MKIYLCLIISCLAITGCVPKSAKPAVNRPGLVGCTQEAKICPDGSAVGRQGPNCEFTACPEEPQKIDYTLDRVTKKKFGIYVTPQNSPVSPEKFMGYHTAVDFEYGDVAGDVSVTALADGGIVYSSSVSGYGGVIVAQHQIKGINYKVIYGHLDPTSLIAKGQAITAGQVIGILGEGFSSETDGERKHLHLGLYKGNDINLKGYVDNESSLNNWANPEEVLFQ